MLTFELTSSDHNMKVWVVRSVVYLGRIFIHNNGAGSFEPDRSIVNLPFSYLKQIMAFAKENGGNL